MSAYTSIKEEILIKLEIHLPEMQEFFGIETIGIFGYVSRSEDTPASDIDILYKFSTSTIHLRQFMGLQDSLEQL
ncbi:MAG: hypothetical protein O0X93_09085 [Methanocorpusculum sp.]|nr:hypothetical protein [Methanocorpusculum sp.]MDE2524684.1 hypothetical protein [Methanocorpusculum sp.]